MPFVQAKCPNCGGMLAVDDAKKATVCQFCGDAFVVEEAVNNYITYNTKPISLRRVEFVMVIMQLLNNGGYIC